MTLPSRILLHALILALAIGLYAQSFSFDFAYDDVAHITHNPLVSDLHSDTLTIFKVPTHPGNLYRPLMTLSFKLNNMFWGTSPYSFHVVNVLLFAFCACLLFELVFGILKDASLAFASVLIFVAHPIHTETVANISGRAELLAGACGLLSALFLRAAFHQRAIARTLLTLLSCAAFFLATLSKESAFTFILLVPLYALLSAPRHTRSVPRQAFTASIIIFFAIAGALSLGLRKLALADAFLIQADRTLINPENPLLSFSFFERIIPALKIFGDYVLLLLCPVQQSADYSLMPDTLLAHVYSLDGLFSILLVMAIFLTLLSARQERFAYFGLWFFVSFALTLNLLTPIGTLMGERLAFTPSMGFVPFLCALLVRISLFTRIGHIIIVSVVVISLLGLTLRRVTIWQSNETLFAQTLEDAPESPKATYNYGLSLMLKGSDLDRAALYFKKSLDVFPTHVQPMKNLADIALQRRNYSRLDYWYRKILELEPDNQQVREQLEKLQEWKESQEAPPPAATPAEETH